MPFGRRFYAKRGFGWTTWMAGTSLTMTVRKAGAGSLRESRRSDRLIEDGQHGVVDIGRGRGAEEIAGRGARLHRRRNRVGAYQTVHDIVLVVPDVLGIDDGNIGNQQHGDRVSRALGVGAEGS